MQTVETSSSIEAQRCRRAQYSGRTAELSLNGSKFLGMVRSVQADRSRSPQRWIVTIAPTVEKPPQLVGGSDRFRSADHCQSTNLSRGASGARQLSRMGANMDAAFSFLISVGIIAFGIWIVAGTIAAGSPLAWTLLGLPTVIVGSISLYQAIRDVKVP